MATGRACLLAFSIGVAGVHGLAQPPTAWGFGALAAGLLAWALWWARPHRLPGADTVPLAKACFCTAWQVTWVRGLCIGAAAAAGLSYGSVAVQSRLADALDGSNEDKVTRVTLRVAELPRLEPDSRIFVADVLESIPEGVPSRIQVRWNSGNHAGPYGRRSQRAQTDAFPELIPGQVWRMALILRHPHGSRNPHGFDYEGHVFAQGIRATGTVRGSPVLLRDDGWASVSVGAQRARHHVRAAMLPYLEELRWGAVLLALAIGDQASVDAADWQTFNRSGLTHLVSISGSHVTLIAVMAAFVMNQAWRRLRLAGRPLADRFPAHLASAWTALGVAWLYCLLAGWGVPARRTFVMLAVVALSLAMRLPLSATHVLAAAAFVVVLLDPWSPLSAGFWLSFLAVWVLMASTGWWGRPVFSPAGRVAGWKAGLAEATRLQILVTLALLPPLSMLFNDVSLISPLANAYAIPVMGALVTPLSLLLAGLALVSGLEWATQGVAWLAHGLLQACMWPTEWLARLPWASLPTLAVPKWATLFAMAGVALALMPKGFPYRSLGWAFMLPVLVAAPKRPAPGDWELHALDVGQGSALVMLTARHALVYDTGVRYSPDADAAQRNLVPFLRAMGVGKINVLVISHADLDHVGGLRSVLESFPVEQSYANFDLIAWLKRETRLLGRRDLPRLPLAVTPCRHGQSWEVDGVRFSFLWPLGEGNIDLDAGTRERNRNACVLRIQGAHHSVLLPGDIGADEERSLVRRGLPPTDIVLAAHHGSRYSSAPEFVSSVEAQHAIAQAARWNRYGHPAPAVVRRWNADGAGFWDTGLDGAVMVTSRAGKLTVEAERERRPRYWSMTSGGG